MTWATDNTHSEEYSICCDAPTWTTAPNRWGGRHYRCTKCGRPCNVHDGLEWWHERPYDHSTLTVICTDLCRDIDDEAWQAMKGGMWLAVAGMLLVLAILTLHAKNNHKM